MLEVGCQRSFLNKGKGGVGEEEEEEEETAETEEYEKIHHNRKVKPIKEKRSLCEFEQCNVFQCQIPYFSLHYRSSTPQSFSTIE